ncbi:DUF6069 family protein [Streptomyces sp. NPDC058457]|uniref:DUF6069 family protein n=1 Tax=Streptomyces sp. NPDC058457 TaxID=3346507 RepID=UPI003666CE78
MSGQLATRSARPNGLIIAGGLVGTAVVAIALNAVVAVSARAAGASGDFQPLHLTAYAPLTVFGVLVGAAAWAIVRARSARPAGLLRTLVPVVVLVSLVPDVLVGASDSKPGTSWGAVIALMVMHFVVAAVAVPAFRRFLPLDGRQG